MTRAPITIPMDADLEYADQLMRSWKIRHLPVVDDTGKVVGILSERDVERAMLPTEGGATVTRAEHRFNPASTVGDFMSASLKTIEEGSSIEFAAQKMLREKLSSLVVVSQHGDPVGIITTDDLLGYLLDLIRRTPATEADEDRLDLLFTRISHLRMDEYLE